MKNDYVKVKNKQLIIDIEQENSKRIEISSDEEVIVKDIYYRGSNGKNGGMEDSLNRKIKQERNVKSERVDINQGEWNTSNTNTWGVE